MLFSVYRKARGKILIILISKSLHPSALILSFFFPPSVGPSGGILVCWVGSLFSYRTLHVQRVIVSVQFTSLHSAETWCLSSVYGSCTEPHRIEFIEWLHDLNIPDDAGWIFLGDFT